MVRSPIVASLGEQNVTLCGTSAGRSRAIKTVYWSYRQACSEAPCCVNAQRCRCRAASSNEDCDRPCVSHIGASSRARFEFAHQQPTIHSEHVKYQHSRDDMVRTGHIQKRAREGYVV